LTLCSACRRADYTVWCRDGYTIAVQSGSRGRLIVRGLVDSGYCRPGPVAATRNGRSHPRSPPTVRASAGRPTAKYDARADADAPLPICSAKTCRRRHSGTTGPFPRNPTLFVSVIHASENVSFPLQRLSPSPGTTVPFERTWEAPRSEDTAAPCCNHGTSKLTCEGHVLVRCPRTRAAGDTGAAPAARRALP
jgi:hypothetical protein